MQVFILQQISRLDFVIYVTIAVTLTNCTLCGNVFSCRAILHTVLMWRKECRNMRVQNQNVTYMTNFLFTYFTNSFTNLTNFLFTYLTNSFSFTYFTIPFLFTYLSNYFAFTPTKIFYRPASAQKLLKAIENLPHSTVTEARG